MKDSPYITHDIGARNDPKLVEVQMEMGGQGLAIWWCLVEMLWENDGYIPYNPKAIAFSLRWATPEEVEKVLTEFGLFENDGKMAWSPSALKRISHKLEVSKRRSESGRRGGMASGASRAARGDANQDTNDPSSSAKPNAKQMLDDRSSGASSSAEALNNKSINQVKNQSRNFSIPPSAADRKRLLEIFFFENNFTDPAGEVERFIGHYGGRGWNFGDGQPVVDLFSAAKNWKPSDGKNTRFPQAFRNWYKMVYACYVNAGNDPADMLVGLVNATGSAKSISLTYRNAEIGMRVMSFVKAQQLDSGWQIEWKKSN